MYYNSNNWNGMTSGGPRPQPNNYPPSAERFQYQDPSYRQHMISKYQNPRMMVDSNLSQPPHLGHTDPSRNPWDGKVPAAHGNMQYGVNIPHQNHYGRAGIPYRPPVSSLMDQSAVRMASTENGRFGQMQRVSYSPMYRNPGAHSAAKVVPSMPVQGSYDASRDVRAQMFPGHGYSGQRSLEPRMSSPPGSNYHHPRMPSTSPQIRAHSAVPGGTTMTSPSYAMGIQQSPQPQCNSLPDIKYPDNASAPFKQTISYMSPRHPAKFQNPGSVDFRAPCNKPAAANSNVPVMPMHPRIPSNEMYRQGFQYNVARTEKPMCPPVSSVDILAPVTSKPHSGFPSDISIPEFSGDFNLDSLLDGPLESGGSFMQQLEDVAPESFSGTPGQDGVQPSSAEKPTNSTQMQPGYNSFSSPKKTPSASGTQPLAQPALQPLVSPEMPKPSNCMEMAALANNTQTDVPFGSNTMATVAPKHPAQSMQLSFASPGQQSHVRRELYQPPDRPMQGNINLAGTSPRPMLAVPRYPEPRPHVGVTHPHAKIEDPAHLWGAGMDGYIPAQRLGHIPPSYGMPGSENHPSLRMKPQPVREMGNGKGPLTQMPEKPFDGNNLTPVRRDGPGSSAKDEAEVASPNINLKKTEAKNTCDSDGSLSKKKKKRPAATLKIKKKKRKKGEDTDDFEGSLPPVSAVDNAEKRRSSRNVKRKQYVETYDAQLSDDLSESGIEALEAAERPVVMKVDDSSEELLVVEKILEVRTRQVLVEKDEECDDTTQKSQGVSDASPVTENDAKETSGNEASPRTTKSEEDKTLPAEDMPDSQMTKASEGDDKIENNDASKPLSEKKKGCTEVEEYFLKYKNYSYLHCEWKSRDEIQDKRIDAKIKRFRSKLASMPEYLKQMDAEPFNPDFVEVERVLDVSTHEEPDGQIVKQYFVKWCSLAYEDSTWENVSDVPIEKIQEFEERCKYRPPSNRLNVPNKAAWRRLNPEDGIFKNGNQLRDYQLEGINWLLFNWHNRRNCILADEMGLGKTIQSITFLQKVLEYGSMGPFLVVAPLSTICNWQREFLTWTDLNAVVYHGSQSSRDMIKTYEFLCRDENLVEIEGAYKMHVVITTYEMIVLENSHLQEIEWKCLIIDEAHRLKNQTCKLADSLRCMDLKYKVLLTGTPLQNNVEELFALLNFLQPEVFDSSEAFMLEFGDLKENSQVEKLQELLKPMMLRRLKEDVEKSLAPKEETIIEVELTNVQKKYYRAILERNFEYLAKGSSAGNVPNLMNTMMELRKCCNHPYLIKGAEEKIQNEYSRDMQLSGQSPLQLMIQSSGKLVLIDKLLPRLKSGGHKVLVFSQMVRCLDILEDYLIQRKYSYERIDGGVRGSDRQMAIDRFSKPESEKFVFLLCTRAGGLGINLTAADTVIIFDSDWNPQNDLQAQARCHRIGQTKPVKIYRLITRNSYEREMFDKASLKLGLDKAVLQSMSGRQDEMNQAVAPALSKQEVENLLKRGAYGAIMDEDDDSKKFCEEDIDQILQRRTHTITIAQGEKGSTFSKASFVTGDEHSDISLNDPNFWEKWAKKADLDIDSLKNNKLIIEQPRHRKQTRRFGGMTQDVEVLAEIGSDSDSDYNDKQTQRKQKAKSRTKNWMKKDYFRVEKSILMFGWGRWSHILSNGRFPAYIGEPELEKVSRAILMHCLKFYNGDDKIKMFMWDLITPSSHSTSNPISNHEGLSAPIARGRKGRQAKDASKPDDGSGGREWVKEVNVAVILNEESFKKHLQQHCNKILLRIRMLCYLQTEILHASDTEAIDFENMDLTFPDIIPESGLAGWDPECDKDLLIGVYKHGYGKYNIIRADGKLCFLKRFGMPDDKSLADDMDYEAEEDNDDPEYKPAKLNFNEFSEFEDSPASNNPGTAPPSPASSTDSAVANKSSSENAVAKPKDTVSSPTKGKEEEKVKEPPTDNSDTNEVKKPPTWPTTAELNMRVRRIVTSYQKQHKQMRFRMMNMDRGSPSPKGKEFTREKMHWTRREEADFYRTVSTFGVEYDKHGNLTWSKFRNIAKLDKKSDGSLEHYYLAFKSMCEQVCGNKSSQGTPGPASTITKVTEERASRTLYRVELLNRIRLDVLRHKDFEARMRLCERSSDLPAWWKPGEHDKELLHGMDKHGVTRTEIHILTDPSLSFLRAMHEHENKRSSKEARKRKLDTSDISTSADKKKKVDSSCDASDAELGPASNSPSDCNENSVKETKSIETSTLFLPISSQRWPKDRVLIQRVEHICYCVIHGRWPVARVEDTMNSTDLINARKYLSSQASPLLKSDSKSMNERKLHLEDVEKHSRPKLSTLSQVLEFEMRKNHHRRGGNLFSPKNQSLTDLMVHTQKMSEAKLPERHEEKSDPKSDLVNMCLYNSKISETLQNLLKTDLSASGELKMTATEKSIINTAMKSFNTNAKFAPKKGHASHSDEASKQPHVKDEVPSNSMQTDSQNSLFQVTHKRKPDKILKKKLMQKPKTGFISPAVLPSDARIPVYNPSEKKKLTGNDAPLNKDLADWLKDHPGFVVDYKNLRQKLSESNKETEEVVKPVQSRSSAKPAKVSAGPSKGRVEQRSHAEEPVTNSSSESEKRALQMNESLLQQSSLNAALMNGLFGTSPEMAALLSAGLLPGMLPPMPDHSKNYRSHKSSNGPHAKQEHQKSSQEEKEAAALAAALFGYPFAADALSVDPRKMKNAYPSSAAQFDEKQLLAANAMNLSTFFGGMPGAVNPLFYSLYSNPDLLPQYPFQHPMLMTSFNEKDFAKHKEESSSSLSELFGVQHHQIPKPPALDLNDPNLQKFMQAQMMDPYMMSALGTMSSKGASDFDNMFQSIYQQLNSMSTPSHSGSSRTDEAPEASETKKKSQTKEEQPMDLTSNLSKK